MKKISMLLVIAILLCFSLCGCKDKKPVEDMSEENPSEAETSLPEDNGYKLPAGASSEWELYKTVLDFLNNGFDYEGLKNIYDPILTFACYSKWEDEPEEIFTLGMDWEESCSLYSRLIELAKNTEFLEDDDGDVEMDYVDLTPFINEFPAEMKSSLGEDNWGFVNFIEDIIYISRRSDENENPFGTDQTHWDGLTKEEFEKTERQEYDNYTDWDKDLFNNFPRIYFFDLGDYIFENESYGMGGYYVEIDGRFYFISFCCSVGSLGG